MRKLFQMLAVLVMLFVGAGSAYANSDKATVMEGADLSSVRRIAVGQPLYVQTDNLAPTKEQLTQILFDASKVGRSYVISYDEIATHIAQDAGTDMKPMERREAAKVFKANVEKYADAYVVLTVANNSRTVFFFDLFKAGTNELLFTYEIRANRSDKDDVTTYQGLTEQFYKNFERAATAQQKNAKK